MPGLPSKCPDCGSELGYHWDVSIATDFGHEQEATCVKCSAMFKEFSEAVEWERVEK